VTKSKRTTDVNGNIISAIELDPWGADTNRSGNSAFQPKKFTSYERDSNGSDEAMFRRYNRKHSRFDQPDPYDGSYSLSDPQSLNRYAYTENDPVNLVDPSRLGPDDFKIYCLAGICFGISGSGPSVDIFAGSGSARGAGGGGGGGGIGRDLGDDLFVGNEGGSGGGGMLDHLKGATAGVSGKQSQCGTQPSANSREVLIVARSIGGNNGVLGNEAHSALVFNVGTNSQPDHYLAQGGPASGKLVGEVKQATSGWWQTFRNAQGANWTTGESMQVPVEVVGRFYLQATQSTRANLGRINESINSRGQPYDYNGANSNSFTHQFITALCGAAFDLTPVGSMPLRGW